MKLYNKFKNKDFYYIVNIINKINKYGSNITQNEVNNYLNHTGTFKEVKNTICNKKDEYRLFYVNNDGTIEPIFLNEIPIRLSYPEKAWLYSIIKDPKAELFLNYEQLIFLENALKNSSNFPYPLSNNDVYICRPNTNKIITYEIGYRNKFKMIMQAIKEHKYIKLTNEADNGQIYLNSILIPYKIEYNNKQETFSVTCYDDKTSEIIRIFLKNIKELKVCELIPDYKKIRTKIRRELERKHTNEPIIIQINNENNALQRSAYIFAHYEKMMYKENDKIYMKIYYYEEFQQEDILRGILQLGMFVKLIEPKSLVEKIKEIIIKKSEIYK